MFTWRGSGHRGKGKLDIAKSGDAVVGRFELQPGWRWSQSVKPLVGTEWVVGNEPVVLLDFKGASTYAKK